MMKLITKKLLLLTFSLLLVSTAPRLSSAQQKQRVEDNELIEARSAYIDGIAAFENEEYQEALKLLNAAYVKLPDHPGVNFALADAYFQISDLANAEYYGKQAAKLDPKNRWYHLKLAHIYQAGGKNETAINELKTALEYHPRDKDLLYELAQLYDSQKMFTEANSIYTKLLYLQGENINLHLQRLKNFNNLGQKDSAITELEKIRDLDPSNLSTLQVLSNYYLEMDRMEEAREVLQNALQISRNNPKTLIMLSDIYIAEAKWDSVGATLSKVMADPSTDSDTKLKVGEYLYSKFEQDSANSNMREATSSVFEEALASGTQSSQLVSLAADFFINTGQKKLALQALEQTNELIPTNDSAWKKRLQLLLQQGRTEEALSVGKQAAEQIPQDPIVLYLLGNAFIAEGQHSQAVQELTAASKLPARKPLKASIHGSLGDALAAMDQWEQAFTQYERSLKFNPDNPGILNNYAYYLSQHGNDLAKAKEMGRRALELDPNNPSYLDTIGWIFYQEGSYQEAEEFIRAAVNAGNTSAEVMEHMGDVLDKLGQKQEAQQWWKKALEKDTSRTHLKDKVST